MEIKHDMAVYKNKEEKRPMLEIVKDYSIGESFESKISMEMHTGTHVDAPLHMIEGGSTIENIDLNKVITPCRVIDFTNIENEIRKEDLISKNIKQGEFILLKTRNSYSEEFDFNFVYLEKSGAEYLREKDIKGVGIDALGIERSQPAHETHRALLGSGIAVVEGLRLKDIYEGEYILFAVPLKIKGAEGAPARAVLVQL
jgi:arylformamidase